MSDKRSKTALRRRISELNRDVAGWRMEAIECGDENARLRMERNKYRGWSEKSEDDCRAAEQALEASRAARVVLDKTAKRLEQERDTAVADKETYMRLADGEIRSLKQEAQELQQFRRAVRAIAHDTSAGNEPDWRVIGRIYLLATEARKHSLRV
jgi:regulator of replication initiation timing